jgi:NTE family protein
LGFPCDYRPICARNPVANPDPMNILNTDYKKAGVVMSSGFFGFFAHTGFIKALEELGIKPAGYAGTSAGALVAAFCAGGLSASQIAAHLTGLKKKDFWDPDYLSLVLKSLVLLKGWTGLLKGHAFRLLLDGFLPVRTFEECPVPCCIVGTDLTGKSKKVFTQGNLTAAVHASGAVPGLFKPACIDGRYYVDGGLVDKAPVRELYELIKPELIIVHYLPTRCLEYPEDYFLRKKFTTLKIANLTSAIAREAEYKLQCDYVRTNGCRVVEISPEVTKVNPGSLEKGPLAIEQAYRFALNYLKSQS